MPKKIQISEIRANQFNTMCSLLREIRTFDAKKYVAALKREGFSKEEALEACLEKIRGIAIQSRGIAELKEVSNG